MALTRRKKEQLVETVGKLLDESKMTVIATYRGTPVKALQSLRRQARDSGTVVKVVKNRLVVQALKKHAVLGNADRSELKGMLLYAFNSQDEAAPAQVLANFVKTQPSLEFVGAFTADGRFIGKSNVREIAVLPGKNALLAQVMACLVSPFNDTIGGLSNSVPSLLDSLATKATN